jgi:hypothetical protein
MLYLQLPRNISTLPGGVSLEVSKVFGCPPIATDARTFLNHRLSAMSGCERMEQMRAQKRKATYSMTSAALMRMAGGTSRPRTREVLRLTTSSNLVGSWIGRSAAFAPLRMRST